MAYNTPESVADYLSRFQMQDGNAPEKDAPEKDDRDAQPPVDTDNR